MNIVHPKVVAKRNIESGDVVRIKEDYFLVVEHDGNLDIAEFLGLMDLVNADVYPRNFSHFNHMVNHLNEHFPNEWELISSERVTLTID